MVKIQSNINFNFIPKKMKPILNLLLFLCLVSFKSKGTTAQDSPITIQAIYDNYDIDNGFSFLHTDESGYEEVITFDDISNELLTKYNLQSNEFVGNEFIITYEEETSEEEEIVLTLLTINLLE